MTGWKLLFLSIVGVQAAAIPTFRYMRILSYVNESAKTILRYMYLAHYFWSIFVVAFL